MVEQMMQHKADKMAAKQTIPAGYKQTEVGVIPEDWSVVSLQDICSIIDGDRGSNYPTSTDFQSYGYCGFLSAANVTKSGFVFDELVFITQNKDRSLRNGKLARNDIVLTTRGTVGNFSLYDNNVPFDNLRINSGMVLIRLSSNSIDVGYLYCFLRSSVFFSQIERMSFGSAQPQLTVKGIQSFYAVCSGNKKEQTAIANVLSDTDVLICSLEQLIAKKQAIKTATMQQLLTGRTRLPQFALRPDGTPKGYKSSELGDIPEDWEIKQIIQFTDCTAGGTPSTSIASYWGGEHPWMSSGELHLKRVFDVSVRITDEGLGNSSTKYVPADSVLIGLAGQGKTRGTVAIAKIPLCTNQSIASVFPSAEHCPEFLFYNLDSRYEELRELSTGDGGRGGLNLAIIRRLKVIFPDKTEQSAIANVLSDMDSELTELEQKLAKARDVKQGMMQQLLTGRIRLPVEQVE
ncbi:restriction endonuclease subunit S [Aeromonas molluscorum]|uniref:Type I restriction modification DNA specificity domain protein n=1 Tax=Aeromonas molluscorum 848 TaxID=1268236 RepID=R1F6Z3_9GAMM|nr:restriction endonuclease subunit S [Aeromonas molluscorum]EOD55563.1 type I restriction modification DNA specificity domain protein [Aeromonas molluscorum 848]